MNIQNEQHFLLPKKEVKNFKEENETKDSKIIRDFRENKQENEKEDYYLNWENQVKNNGIQKVIQVNGDIVVLLSVV